MERRNSKKEWIFCQVREGLNFTTTAKSVIKQFFFAQINLVESINGACFVAVKKISLRVRFFYAPAELSFATPLQLA